MSAAPRHLAVSLARGERRQEPDLGTAVSSAGDVPPRWSPAAPDRVVYTSNESGIWQVHAWDLVTGNHRQVTDHPVGLLDGTPTLDGEGVLWFQDETGDESGRWFVQPFHGGKTRPFLDGVPHGWNAGLAQAPGIVAAGVSDRDGFAVFVSLDGGPAREIHRSPRSVELGSAQEEASSAAGSRRTGHSSAWSTPSTAT